MKSVITVVKEPSLFKHVEKLSLNTFAKFSTVCEPQKQECVPKDVKRDPPKDNVKVTVCGSTGSVGRPLSLFLKKSDKINELSLFDTTENCCALGIELAYINLKCKIKSYCSPTLMRKALENSNIVVIASFDNGSTTGVKTPEEEFKMNSKSVKEVVEACADVCPKAIIAIVANPVSSLVPLACEVLKKRNKAQNINKILGVTRLDTLRCVSMISSMLNMPRDKITVPVVGGTTAETIVPLLSQMAPQHDFLPDEVTSLTDGLRAAITEVAKAGGTPSITTAYSAAQFVKTLCTVIKGEQNVKDCAFVATPHWLALGYLACPVKLSPQGIEEVLYPPINDYEQCLLSEAEAQLKKEIKQGMDYIRCDTAGAELVKTE